jgi:exopolysaccharide biosynthesis polyprenyl glycosylphosphotransferase
MADAGHTSRDAATIPASSRAGGTATSSRPEVLVPLLTVVLDALAIEGSFLFAYWLRFRSPFFEAFGYTHLDAPPIEGYLLSSVFVILMWLLLFNIRKMYRPRRNVSLSDELFNVVKVVSIGMLIVMSAAFFVRELSYSRIVFGLLWATSIVAIFAGRALVHRIERGMYRKGRNLKQAVIIGNNGFANEVYSRLHGHPAFGINVVGYFAAAPAHEELLLAQAKYLGPLAGAPEFIRANRIELGIIAVRAEDHGTLHDLIAECEGITIEFVMVPDLLEMLTSRVQVLELDGIPFLRIKGIPLTFWGRMTKRAFDIVVSASLLLLLSPFFLLIMVLIRIDSRGPVFFRQERVGLDGTRFTMYKFRSMIAGAEHEDEKAGLGLKDDPRRTRLGKLLRKSSADELPQLINVLRGDMSLVGPRPERASYVERFQESIPRYLDRHRVKTGITGWAQVNGLRGNTSLSERIKYDLYYVENWSLAFDIKILLRTIRAMVSVKQVE